MAGPARCPQMSYEWQVAGGKNQLAMLGAASSIIMTKHPAVCLVCRQNPLRFYYHELVSTPRRTGTIGCGAISARFGTTFAEFSCRRIDCYNDPFATTSDAEFDTAERDKNKWFPMLDRLWAQSALPHQFNTKKE